MKVRALFPLAAAAGLWLAGPRSPSNPRRCPAAVANPNQTLADAVAGQAPRDQRRRRGRRRHRRPGRHRHPDRHRQGRRPEGRIIREVRGRHGRDRRSATA